MQCKPQSWNSANSKPPAKIPLPGCRSLHPTSANYGRYGAPGKASSMIKDTPEHNMKMMSNVMKDMSQQMMEMSTAMANGTVSVKQMKKMQERMTEIQKRMSGIEMHK
jgi:hypothetical protein